MKQFGQKSIWNLDFLGSKQRKKVPKIWIFFLAKSWNEAVLFEFELRTLPQYGYFRPKNRENELLPPLKSLKNT